VDKNGGEGWNDCFKCWCTMCNVNVTMCTMYGVNIVMCTMYGVNIMIQYVHWSTSRPKDNSRGDGTIIFLYNIIYFKNKEYITCK
jgi:hypothetical protein